MVIVWSVSVALTYYLLLKEVPFLAVQVPFKRS